MPPSSAARPVDAEPEKGSSTRPPPFEEARTMRLHHAQWNCAGCGGPFSLELRRSLPVVTFGNCQTSEGFLPSGLQRNFPFFSDLTFDVRTLTSSKLNVYVPSSLTKKSHFSLRGAKLCCFCRNPGAIIPNEFLMRKTASCPTVSKVLEPPFLSKERKGSQD